jgi:hypothetical protein
MIDRRIILFIRQLHLAIEQIGWMKQSAGDNKRGLALEKGQGKLAIQKQGETKTLVCNLFHYIATTSSIQEGLSLQWCNLSGCRMGS